MILPLELLYSPTDKPALRRGRHDSSLQAREFRRGAAGRDVAPLTSRRSVATDRGTSSSIEKISWHPGWRLLSQETSQTAISGRGFSTVASDTRARRSNTVQASSTSVISS